MPRSLRVFVEGGIYHVYNRFASGESVFADPEQKRFVLVAAKWEGKQGEWPDHRQSGSVRIVNSLRMTADPASMFSDEPQDRNGENCRRRSTLSEAPPSYSSMWPTLRAALVRTTSWKHGD